MQEDWELQRHATFIAANLYHSFLKQFDCFTLHYWSKRNEDYRRIFIII